MDLRSAQERSAPSASGLRYLHILSLLGIVAVGAALRLYQIGSEGLWIDEAFSIWLAKRPLDEMVHWVQDVDHHPPLYYALLQGWTAAFGITEGGARALSALFGVLTIPVVHGLGRRVANERVGLVAALILALSPFHIRFAQEARMYTLLTFQAALALHAFITLYGEWAQAGCQSACRLPIGFCSNATSTGSRRLTLAWTGYVFFTAAMLWTHNTAFFFPIATNMLVLGRLFMGNPSTASGYVERMAPRRSLRGSGRMWLRSWSAAQAAVFLLWLPWLPTFVSQAVDVYRRFWLPVPTLGSVLGTIGAFLYEAPSWPLLPAILVNVGLVALALLGLRALHHRSGHAWTLGTMLLTPFVGQWLVSLLRPIFYARTLIWSSIPLYLMVAAGVGSLEVGAPSRTASRRVFLAILGVLVAINGAALCNYHANAEKESWDDAAALVAQRVRPGDLLLFNDAWGQIPFDYYFGRLYNAQPGSAVVKRGLPVDLFDQGVLEPEMTERHLPRLRALVANHQRVWLVYSHQWYTDPQGLIPQGLAAVLDLREQWTFKGLQVCLYVAG